MAKNPWTLHTFPGGLPNFAFNPSRSEFRELWGNFLKTATCLSIHSLSITSFWLFKILRQLPIAKISFFSSAYDNLQSAWHLALDALKSLGCWRIERKVITEGKVRGTKRRSTRNRENEVEFKGGSVYFRGRKEVSGEGFRASDDDDRRRSFSSRAKKNNALMAEAFSLTGEIY